MNSQKADHPNVIVVDREDNIIGAMDRATAVSQGMIVRIVRIFLFNSKGELFMQKRGPNVDFPNLWDQSVGGHVDEGEDYQTAAQREMAEEIGIKAAVLTEITKYYTATEYNHGHFKRFNMLYTAVSDSPVVIEPDEVSEGRWITPADLDRLMDEQPELFTQGFITAYQKYKESRA